MGMRSILKMIQLWIWIWVRIVLKMMIGQRNTWSSEDMNRNQLVFLTYFTKKKITISGLQLVLVKKLIKIFLFPSQRIYVCFWVHKSNHISSWKRFHLFYTKNLHFLFYTITFTKHPHQFIYFTRLFNKIFILHQFFIIFPNSHTFLI